MIVCSVVRLTQFDGMFDSLPRRVRKRFPLSLGEQAKGFPLVCFSALHEPIESLNPP